jgi:hypothetical protein
MTSYTSDVPPHSAPANGHRGKVGFQWTVYHQQSDNDTHGIVANGITDRPDRAKTVVEMILADVDEAAWGLLVRVVLDVSSAYRAEQPVGDWPPAGEIQLCRRAEGGGYLWGPLYPREGVLAKDTRP